MKSNDGFTLLELVTVIALVAIVSVATVPKVKEMTLGYTLTNDMASLKSVINSARLESIKIGAFTSVALTPDADGGASFVAFVDTDQDGILDAGERVISQGEFHASMTVDKPQFVNDELNGGYSMQFNRLGFPFGLVAGAIINYSGTIDAQCQVNSEMTIYQRLTISTTGNLSISKQTTPFS